MFFKVVLTLKRTFIEQNQKKRSQIFFNCWFKMKYLKPTFHRIGVLLISSYSIFVIYGRVLLLICSMYISKEGVFYFFYQNYMLFSQEKQLVPNKNGYKSRSLEKVLFIKQRIRGC